MTDWKEITDPEELFRLKREGWEIQRYRAVGDPSDGWYLWKGEEWLSNWQFRARPPQPKMKKVKVEAYLSEYELRWLNIEACNKPAPLWIRIPAEDKEIEVPDDN